MSGEVALYTCVAVRFLNFEIAFPLIQSAIA
jgi:hypothetical protein